MRKLMFALCLVVMAGCNNKDEFDVYEVEYDCHSYVVFENHRGNSSVIHNPNCKCYD